MRHPLQIHWSDDADKDLSRLDKRTRKRIIDAVERFAQTGHGDIDTITGETNLYRQRVGKRRIFFEFLENDRAINIVRVRSREGAYKP